MDATLRDTLSQVRVPLESDLEYRQGQQKARFETDICSRAKAASGVFVSKIANLASKKNREIRQVTVAVVFEKISQSRPGFKTIELESVGLRSFLRKRTVVSKSVHTC